MNILVLGGSGFIGRNICSQIARVFPFGADFVDFTKEAGTGKFSDYDVIINCVGRFGGLPFNKSKGKQVFFENNIINNNINILVDHIKPKRYIKIFSACMYPAVDSDVSEEVLYQSYNPDESVKWSALANIQDLKYLKHSDIPYDALVVTNCYGIGDYYDDRSHVIGSVLNKMKNNSRQINLIGTGLAKRDFMYAPDLGNIIKKLLQVDATCSALNVATGQHLTIKQTVETIANKYQYFGDILWGESKDNGVLKKGLDTTKLNNLIGPFDYTSFERGISQVVNDFKQTQL